MDDKGMGERHTIANSAMSSCLRLLSSELLVRISPPLHFELHSAIGAKESLLLTPIVSSLDTC